MLSGKEELKFKVLSWLHLVTKDQRSRSLFTLCKWENSTFFHCLRLLSASSHGGHDTTAESFQEATKYHTGFFQFGLAGCSLSAPHTFAATICGEGNESANYVTSRCSAPVANKLRSYRCLWQPLSCLNFQCFWKGRMRCTVMLLMKKCEKCRNTISRRSVKYWGWQLRQSDTEWHWKLVLCRASHDVWIHLENSTTIFKLLALQPAQ